MLKRDFARNGQKNLRPGSCTTGREERVNPGVSAADLVAIGETVNADEFGIAVSNVKGDGLQILLEEEMLDISLLSSPIEFWWSHESAHA